MYKPNILTNLQGRMHYFILLCALLFISLSTKGQDKFIKSIEINDSLSVNDIKRNTIDSLQRRGFLEAEYIDFLLNDSTLQLQFKKGNRYRWAHISLSGQKEGSKQLQTKLDDLEFADQFVLSSILDVYSRQNFFNKGYPFAEFDLLIDSIDKQQMYARVLIQKGALITYDSLVVQPAQSVVKTNYLQKLLKASYNSVFSTSDFLAISKRMDFIEGVRMKDLPSVNFRNRKAEVVLNVESEKSSSFDAFLGVVPSGDETIITGQADVRLNNLFKSGIEAALQWQQYNADDRNLELSSSQIASLENGIGYEVGFGLLQEDSSFLNTSLKIGANILAFQKMIMEVSYRRSQTNILSDYTSFSESDTVIRSSTINAVGVEASYNNPSRYPGLENKFAFNFQTRVGQKFIARDQDIPSQWQVSQARSFNLAILSNIMLNKKLLRRFVIETSLSLAFLENKFLAQNDFFRLGGLNSLRGFQQNEIFTRNYQLLSVNYRYFLNNLSNLFLLTDIGRTAESPSLLYALGAGLDIRTANGWFRLIYALGNNFEKKLNFNDAKLHIGYIAVF